MTLYVGEGATFSYDGTAVTGAISFDGPKEKEGSKIEKTKLSDTKPTYRKGFKEDGEANVKVELDPSECNTIYGHLGDGTSREMIYKWQKSVGDGTATATFNARTIAFNVLETAHGGNVYADIGMELDGTCTYA